MEDKSSREIMSSQESKKEDYTNSKSAQIELKLLKESIDDGYMEVKDTHKQKDISSIIQATHSRVNKALIITKCFSLLLLASIVYLLNKGGFKAN